MGNREASYFSSVVGESYTGLHTAGKEQQSQAETIRKAPLEGAAWVAPRGATGAGQLKQRASLG